MRDKKASGKSHRSGQYGEESTSKLFNYDPDKLVLVKDEVNPMFDDRVHNKPDEAMVLNIMAEGVHESLAVRFNGKDENGMPIVEVIDGRQRTICAREANRRLREAGKEPVFVPCLVKKADAATLMGVMISTNEVRKDDTPPRRYLQVRLDGDGRWHGVAASPMPARRGYRNGETHCGKSFKGLRVGERVKVQDTSLIGCQDCARDARTFIDRFRAPLLGRAREVLAKLTPAEQRVVFAELKCCSCTQIATAVTKSPAVAAGMVIGGLLGAVAAAVSKDDKKGRLR